MIRPYTPHDTNRMVKIWRTASDLAHPFLTKTFQDKEADNVRNIYPQYAKISIQELNGQPVGFIAMLENEIGGLFLDPEYHGKGLGRSMVDFASQDRAFLTLDVFRDNNIGRHFYKAYGFKQVGEYLHKASGQITLKMRCEQST